MRRPRVDAVVEKLADLIRETSSSLPEDVLGAIRRARRRTEKGSAAEVVLGTILENCARAKRQGTPLCQDTGTLTFFVDAALKRRVTPARIRAAVAEATVRGHLRKNCLDAVTGRSYDDNCAEGAPVIRYRETGDGAVTLLMKGGGSENMSRQYSLPDAALGAGRDLAGVRACVLDAVHRAQGFGCAPGVLGVCVGGDRATGYAVAKEQLLRPLGERTPGEPGRLERQLLEEANTLGIGPMGLGGAPTLLGVRLAARPRVPASFFVTVAYMCWACRRRTVRFSGNVSSRA